MKHTVYTLLLLFLLPFQAIAGPTDNVLRGDSCLQSFDLFHALAYYQQALAERDEPQVRMKIAECHYRRGDYRKCLSTLQPVPADSLNHAALRRMFYSYQALDDLKNLKKIGISIVKLYPLDAEVLVDLCKEYNKEMEPIKAFGLLAKYQLQDMNNLAVNRVMAESDFYMKDFVNATADYQQLLAQGDTSYINLFSLGVCYERRREYEDATEMQKKNYLNLANKYLSMAIAISDSGVAGALYHQGAILRDMGSITKSQRCYEKAITLINPDSSIAYICWRGLADVCYMQQDYPRSVEAFEKAVQYDPTSLTSRFFLAVSYEAVGRGREAKAQYAQFLADAQREEHPSETLLELMKQAKERSSKL